MVHLNVHLLARRTIDGPSHVPQHHKSDHPWSISQLRTKQMDRAKSSRTLDRSEMHS